jgi:hypothetical protein
MSRIPLNPGDFKPIAIDLQKLDPNFKFFASEFFKHISKQIIEFEKGLNEEEEVGARLVSFGQTETFHIEDMSYQNPSLIMFSGTNQDGKPVKLIQNVNQISILLTVLPRIRDRVRIGFTLEKKIEK